MPHRPLRPPHHNAGVRETSSDRRSQRVSRRLLEAENTVESVDIRLTSAEPSNGSGEQTSNGPSTGALGQKDENLLTYLIRFRLLSIDQIQRLVFPGQHQALVSRALKRLQERRLITSWDEPRGRGGRRRYVFPTAAGIRLGIELARRKAADTPAERVVASMLPAYGRRPLQPAGRTGPPFLAHQRECNHLAISFEQAGIASWSSTWDRPFVPVIGGVAMPQPDAVLVLQRTGGDPRLVFLEHDRGQESRAHFERAKIERYVQLARLPRFCDDLFGFREFAVAVTVTDVVRRRPLDRLKSLSRFVHERGASALFRFTLAGWAHAQPSGQIWFADGAVPHDRVLRPDGHSGLRALDDPALPGCQEAGPAHASTRASTASDASSGNDTSDMPPPLPARFNDGAQHHRESLHNPHA